MAKKINIPTTVGTAAAKKPEIKDELIRHRYVIESQDPKSKTWRHEDHIFGDHVDDWQNGVDSGETFAWKKVNRLRNDFVPGTGFSMDELTDPDSGHIYAKMMQGELAKGETHVHRNPEGRKIRVRRFGEYRQTKTDADGFTGTRVYLSGSLKEGGDVLKEPATLPSYSLPSILSKTQMSPIARRVIGTSRKPHGNTGNPKGNLGKAKGNPTTAAAAAAKRAANSGTKIPKTAAGVLGKAEPKKPAPKKPAPKKGK